MRFLYLGIKYSKRNFVNCRMTTKNPPLLDYEIRAKYRKLIQTVSSAEAKRILTKGTDEAEPVDKIRLAAIIKG